MLRLVVAAITVIFLCPGVAPAFFQHRDDETVTVFDKVGEVLIPFRIEPHVRESAKEMLLYVSRDQGKTWKYVARAAPDKIGFRFLIRHEGRYWFAGQLVRKDGGRVPRNMRKYPRPLKVFVRIITGDIQLDR